jgi:hypothetical protein
MGQVFNLHANFIGALRSANRAQYAILPHRANESSHDGAFGSNLLQRRGLHRVGALVDWACYPAGVAEALEV